jgi:hypothetical protein
MYINLYYNKKKNNFIVKLNKKLLLNLKLNKYKKVNNYMSIRVYNYLLFLRILRQFGLSKPIKNNLDYF